MAGRIFINYRRDDSIGTAGRLRDRLVQEFGRKNLFMDVDDIPAGVDFVVHLNAQVGACDVFLAIIGPNWIDAKDDNGSRRLDHPEDHVSFEIAAALGRDIRIIPVLVDGARLPKADELPLALRPLVRRNAVELRNSHFSGDAEALARKVRESLTTNKAPHRSLWPLVTGIALLLLSGAGSVVFYDTLTVVPSLPGAPQPHATPTNLDDSGIILAPGSPVQQRDVMRGDDEKRRLLGLRSEQPSTDPRDHIEQFVNTYDGGDCFFVAPVTGVQGKATLDGFGDSIAPFEVFNYEFKLQNGFEASIGVHQVLPAQCPAVRFLSRARNRRGVAPRLDISTSKLCCGEALTGTVAEFGNRNVELLLVSADGFVHSLTKMLKPSDNDKTFTVGIQKNDPGPAQPQLLFAIVSSKPMEALKLPSDGQAAETVFANVGAEALQNGLMLNVSAKYFTLGR
jgi:TIR domain